MRRERRTRILLVVLLVVLVPLLQRARVEYQRNKALASISGTTGEHDCCDHTGETITKLNESLKRDPAWTEARLMLAEAYSTSNDKRNEEKQYRLAVRYAPNDPKTQFKLGEFLMFGKRHKEAVKVFRLSISLDGRSIEARENLARCLEQSGQMDTALKAWREVLSRDPGSVPAEQAVKRLERSSKN